MEKYSQKNGVSVYAYKGDAMTLLAFDLDKSLIDGFVGFTIHVTANKRNYYLNNRLAFKNSILKKNNIDDNSKLSSLFSPFQKFRWVHIPSNEHFIDNPYFGIYSYDVTPRYIVNDVLLPVDKELTVRVNIEVSPFDDGDFRLGFTRAFVSSQAYAYHFGNNAKMRPNKTDLIFNIKDVSGKSKKWDKIQKKYVDKDYTYKEQHEYLGWQARDRIMEFLDEVDSNKNLTLDVFAYDLNEPLIVDKLINLSKEGRVRIILDNSETHITKDCFEGKFETLFKKSTNSKNSIFRGKFQGLAHSKVFIQRLKKNGKAKKVLTGSTNFTTNGIYINANHTITIKNKTVAQMYADVFDLSFSEQLMDDFDKTDYAVNDNIVKEKGLPDMTIHFSPHQKQPTDVLFKKISDKILSAESDVLFAIMKDDSKGDILAAVRKQVESDKVFTYGITDMTNNISLYKPDSKKGIKVSGRGTETDLPYPFAKVAKIPGHNIHHKFIVVDFKGDNPVVYCGSSNLAYTPEQKNGDNLIEIRDRDVVNAFAIEAIRLIDHFHWRNRKTGAKIKKIPLQLDDSSNKEKWYKAYYNKKDLKYLERTLFMR